MCVCVWSNERIVYATGAPPVMARLTTSARCVCVMCECVSVDVCLFGASSLFTRDIAFDANRQEWVVRRRFIRQRVRLKTVFKNQHNRSVEKNY